MRERERERKKERKKERERERKSFPLLQDERPYGISVFENFLYVTSWKDDSIKRIGRFQGHNVTTFPTNLTEPMHIHVFHRQRQPEGEGGTVLVTKSSL